MTLRTIWGHSRKSWLIRQTWTASWTQTKPTTRLRAQSKWNLILWIQVRNIMHKQHKSSKIADFQISTTPQGKLSINLQTHYKLLSVWIPAQRIPFSYENHKISLPRLKLQKMGGRHQPSTRNRSCMKMCLMIWISRRCRAMLKSKLHVRIQTTRVPNGSHQAKKPLNVFCERQKLHLGCTRSTSGWA